MPVATPCLTVGLLAMVLWWLGGCDRGERKAPDEADSVAIDRAERAAQAWQAATPGYPDSPAAQARFERWQLRAIVQDATGLSHVIEQRFDRLAAGPADTPSATAQTPWRFNSVLLAQATIGAENRGSVRRFDISQRVAPGQGQVEASAVQAGPLNWSVTPVTGRGHGSGCQARWHWQQTEAFELRAVTDQCPVPDSIESLTGWAVSGQPVRGELLHDDQWLAVSGQAWIERLWGTPPVGQGPVLIDRFSLSLPVLGLLEGSRSRRRSGNGPVTLQARLQAAPDRERASVQSTQSAGLELSGLELQIDASGTSWQLMADEPRMDIMIESLVPESGPESGPELTTAMAGDARRVQAVRVTGTHSGFGWLDLALPQITGNATAGS